ncbi:Vps62-related protein [Allokutzneria sp. A3M-2-11 16]|uniref:Vps62-related protein n=1 Tax=Allokutzneria sp. A3M-2-11 16 TaxID=2962043 RepID=UPI0020B7560A|nr:Vps62-related protein [Allokutzneria sp. A3M-2-11 16]MCP3802401.1 Vps62-related protein [Allokutzneria sp. A3M-2-11 16]
MRARWVGGVCAVLLMVAGCNEKPVVGQPAEPSDVAPVRAPGAARKATAEKYAPFIWFAKGEEYGPMDAATFISTAKLKWSHDDGCPDADIAAPPDLAALSGRAEPYAHRKKSGLPRCDFEGEPIKSSTYSVPRRTEELGEEGFYLDGMDTQRRQNGAGAPTYWQVDEPKGERVRVYTYWRFHAWNNARNVEDVIPVPGSVAGLDGDHEGDWERVTLITDLQDTPRMLVFNGHGSQCRLDWPKVEKTDGRPVGYSAKGTHASYPTTGTHGWMLDRTDQGTLLDTRADLRWAEGEAWWGYAGGWGSVGRPGAVMAKERTGPPGPRPNRGLGTPWTADPCDEPGALVPEYFVGTWQTPDYVYQPGTTAKYKATMTLRGGRVGDKVGEIVYPGLECRGELTLEKADRSAVMLTEKIVAEPVRSCVKRGTIALTPTEGAGSRPGLYWVYRELGSGPVLSATAEFVKTG